MKTPRDIRLGFDLSRPMADADYRQLWKDLGRIEIRLVEKIGECPHQIGDTYYYENPYQRPEKVCFALLHVLDLYTWRMSFGFPSWNERQPAVYRTHCPDHTGTISEMRREERSRIHKTQADPLLQP